jgi:hypothetical protein
MTRLRSGQVTDWLSQIFTQNLRRVTMRADPVEFWPRGAMTSPAELKSARAAINNNALQIHFCNY